LCRRHSGYRRSRAGERDEERVTLGAQLNTAVLLPRPSQQDIMVGKDLAVSISGLPKQLGRPLNVSEHESNETLRKSRSVHSPIVFLSELECRPVLADPEQPQRPRAATERAPRHRGALGDQIAECGVGALAL
jgi:hypothetical protein